MPVDRAGYFAWISPRVGCIAVNPPAGVRRAAGEGERDVRARMARYPTAANQHGVGPVLALGTALALLLACQAAPSAAPASTGTAQSNGAAASAALGGPNSGGAPANWQQAWEALQAAAKQEGRLSVHGSPTPETRQGIVEAFR